MLKTNGRNHKLFNATHLKVLEVARGLFAREGFDAVSTQRIAEAADVAHGSVFHHYKSKRELFLEVHDGQLVSLLDSLKAVSRDAETPRERLDRIWRAYLAAGSDAAMRRILLMDGPHVIAAEDPGKSDPDAISAYFEAALDGLIHADMIRGRSGRALAILLRAALDRAILEIARVSDEKAFHAAMTEEVALFIDQIR
jgi:AcrR family transcriptional regulator